MIQHCLDNRLTDGGKVFGFMYRPRSIPETFFTSVTCNYFCHELCKPRELERLGGLVKLNKFIYPIGSRTRALPAFGIVPQQLRYRVPRLH
jgi:hypothetical protein